MVWGHIDLRCKESTMGETVRRRDFLIGTALTAGSLLAVVGAARAEETFRSYTQIDPSLFTGINRVKDAARKSALEQKHAPVVDVPATAKAGEPFVAKIAVGEVLHPMSPAHYIHFLEVYAGNEVAGRVEFSPTFGVPEATLRLTLDKPVTLVVREYCNLHGLWESRRDIAVA
jgi:superoxide reductase